MKINKTNTIISLTGSNPLHEESINHMRKIGILVYLDIDKNVIINRCHKMKVNRIVGQSTRPISEILEFRRSIYEKYYDIRVIIEDEESIESVANKIINLMERDQEYLSTRGSKEGFLFFDVIKEGLAKDRGLFIPTYIPKFQLNQIKRMIDMSYEERCLRILEGFPIGDLSPQTLNKFINKAYSSFDSKVLPLLHLERNHYIMEEYNGPSASFKDLALQLFPLFFQESIKGDKNKNIILVATSGDTGSAVLTGFKDTNTSVIVLFPQGGVR